MAAAMVPESPTSTADTNTEGMGTRAKTSKTASKTVQLGASALAMVEAALQTVTEMSIKVNGRAAAKEQLEAAIAMLKEEARRKAMEQPDQATMNKEKDDKAIDKKLDFVINLLTKEGPRSWAQVAATPPLMDAKRSTIATEKKQQMEKARKERSQYEVTLTISDAPDTTNEILASTPHKDITERLQRIVDEAALPEKPKLQGVNKLGREMIRVQVRTTEGAKAMKSANIDWNEAYPGMKLYNPKYGIVIHGVPTHAIDLNTDYSETKNEWERQNANNEIKITSITPLRKGRERHKPTAHRSIVVFTQDATAADRCIKFGFFIDSQKLKAERYAPHLHINQCYKCHSYGHRSTTCKKKEKCGKCAKDDHPTSQCASDTLRCVNCEGKHEAWHVECPSRSTEGRRLAMLRMETSPFYTT